MKKSICFSLIVLFLVQINNMTTNLRSSDMISFSSSNEKNQKNEKPSVMENIFDAKSVGVTTMAHRFKEKLSTDNYESPYIRRLDTNFDDITSRVASGTSQSISNSAAFDVAYRNQKDYYDNRRFFIYDNNFYQMENYLINGFKQELDEVINFDPKEEHASAFNKEKLNNMDFSRTPYVRNFLI